MAKCLNYYCDFNITGKIQKNCSDCPNENESNLDKALNKFEPERKELYKSFFSESPNREKIMILEEIQEKIADYELGKFRDYCKLPAIWIFEKIAKKLEIEIIKEWESDCYYIDFKYKNIFLLENYCTNTGEDLLEDQSWIEVLELLQLIFENINKKIKEMENEK